MDIKDRIIVFLSITAIGLLTGVFGVLFRKLMAYFGLLRALTYEENILTIVVFSLFGLCAGFYEGFLRRRW